MNEETLAIRLYLCLCGGLGAYSLQFFLYQEEFQQSSRFILRTDVTLVCSLNDNIISLGVSGSVLQLSFIEMLCSLNK